MNHQSHCNDNHTNSISDNSIENKVRSIILSRKEFYTENHHFLNINNYRSFLSQITSENILSNTESFDSNTGILVTQLQHLNEQYNLFPITNISFYCNDIYLYKQYTIIPSNLFLFINKTLSKHNEYIKSTPLNNDEHISTSITFIGNSGIGKTSGILFLTYIYRLYPSNIVIPIFNINSFKQNLKEYLINETIYAISYIYMLNNNNGLDMNDLYELYNDLEILSFESVVYKIMNVLNNVITKYKEEVFIYFIFDSYQDICKDMQKEITVIRKAIENLKENNIGYKNEFYYTNVKVITIIDTMQPNSNVVIKDMLRYYNHVYSNNQNIIIDIAAVFMQQLVYNVNEQVALNEVITILNEDYYLYLSEEEYENIFMLSDGNYTLLKYLIDNGNNDFSLTHLNQLRENEFFQTISNFILKYIQVQNTDNEHKLLMLYDLFSYQKISQIQEPYVYSYYNENYDHYNYDFVIPILHLDSSNSNKTNETIKFKCWNNMIIAYIKYFNFDKFDTHINYSNISFQFYIEIFKRTKSQILKGIILEDITYHLFYTHHHIHNSFYIEIPYSICVINEDMSVDINNICPWKLKFVINNVEKSHNTNEDVFRKEYLYCENNFNDDKSKNGVYFLNHHFPCFDVVIIQDYTFYLIQMKKTLKNEHIITLQKDLNELHSMIEDQSVFEMLSELNRINNKKNTDVFPNEVNTKLNFWIQIAKLLKYTNNTKIDVVYCFTYQNIANDFEYKDMLYNEFKAKIEDIFNTKKEEIIRKYENDNEFNLLSGGNHINSNNIVIDNQRKQIKIQCNKVTSNIVLFSLDNFLNSIKPNDMDDNFFQNLK